MLSKVGFGLFLVGLVLAFRTAYACSDAERGSLLDLESVRVDGGPVRERVEPKPRWVRVRVEQWLGGSSFNVGSAAEATGLRFGGAIGLDLTPNWRHRLVFKVPVAYQFGGNRRMFRVVPEVELDLLLTERWPLYVYPAMGLGFATWHGSACDEGCVSLLDDPRRIAHLAFGLRYVLAETVHVFLEPIGMDFLDIPSGEPSTFFLVLGGFGFAL
jgi:hypothetical protein